MQVAAASSGSKEIVELLLNRGAHINVRTADGRIAALIVTVIALIVRN